MSVLGINWYHLYGLIPDPAFEIFHNLFEYLLQSDHWNIWLIFCLHSGTCYNTASNAKNLLAGEWTSWQPTSSGSLIPSCCCTIPVPEPPVNLPDWFPGDRKKFVAFCQRSKLYFKLCPLYKQTYIATYIGTVGWKVGSHFKDFSNVSLWKKLCQVALS